MKNYLKICFFFVLILVSVLFISCKEQKTEIKKVKNLEFTVVEEIDMPKELKEIIEEKKAQPFKISYSDSNYLYIVVGYDDDIIGLSQKTLEMLRYLY